MPYETLPPAQRRSYDLLLSALYGVQIGESERAALWWVASSATPGHIRALARLIARARSRGGHHRIDARARDAASSSSLTLYVLRDHAPLISGLSGTATRSP